MADPRNITLAKNILDKSEKHLKTLTDMRQKLHTGAKITVSDLDKHAAKIADIKGYCQNNLGNLPTNDDSTVVSRARQMLQQLQQLIGTPEVDSSVEGLLNQKRNETEAVKAAFDDKVAEFQTFISDNKADFFKNRVELNQILAHAKSDGGLTDADKAHFREMHALQIQLNTKIDALKAAKDAYRQLYFPFGVKSFNFDFKPGEYFYKDNPLSTNQYEYDLIAIKYDANQKLIKEILKKCPDIATAPAKAADAEADPDIETKADVDDSAHADTDKADNAKPNPSKPIHNPTEIFTDIFNALNEGKTGVASYYHPGSTADEDKAKPNIIAKEGNRVHEAIFTFQPAGSEVETKLKTTLTGSGLTFAFEGRDSKNDLAKSDITAMLTAAKEAGEKTYGATGGYQLDVQSFMTLHNSVGVSNATKTAIQSALKAFCDEGNNKTLLKDGQAVAISKICQPMMPKVPPFAANKNKDTTGSQASQKDKVEPGAGAGPEV